MKSIKNLVLLLFVIMLIAGCGGNKSVSMTGNPSKQTIENIPDWYINRPEDPNYIFAAGTARSRDLQLAKDKASDVCRMEIAKAIETHFKGFSKRFQEEVGTDEDAQYLDQFTQATKSVVSTTLRGTTTEKTKILPEQNMYRAYVLMKMPLGEVNEALLNKIKQQEQLYTRFRSTQVFQELEEEVNKLEQSREMGDN